MDVVVSVVAVAVLVSVGAVDIVVVAAVAAVDVVDIVGIVTKDVVVIVEVNDVKDSVVATESMQYLNAYITCLLYATNGLNRTPMKLLIEI